MCRESRMSHHGARCAHCSKPIERTELVVFDAGALYHQPCFVQTGGAYELLRDFLRRHYPSPFCHACLSKTLTISYEDTRKAVTALRMDRQFVVLLGGRCAGCRQPRVTIQAASYGDPPNPAE